MSRLNLKKSQLKEKLSKNQLTFGSWITIPSFQVIEIMATAGFDWLVIDIEHSQINMFHVAELISAIQGSGMQALVRVGKNDELIIKRVLDSGADGLIIPMVNTEKDAQLAVNLSNYPPIGSRGVGLSRANLYGSEFDKYKRWLEKELVIIAQIEHIDAVDNLKKIINVNGIDGILLGPYDLSASMGYPGEYNKNEVKSAIENIEHIAKANNFPLGFHVIESDFNICIDKLDSGYNLIAFSIDFLFLGDKVRNEMKNLKNIIK